MITALHTGLLSVTGVGRVGSYESAVRRRKCRAHRYWAIEEQLHEVRVTTGPGWEKRTLRVERTDLGKFKTKDAAIRFLAATGLPLQGDPAGYPRIQLPK